MEEVIVDEDKLITLYESNAKIYKILKDNGFKNKGVVWQKRLCVSHEADGEFLQVQTIIPIE